MAGTTRPRSILSFLALAVFLGGCGAGGGVTSATLAASIKAASQAAADQLAATGSQPGALVKSVTCEPIHAKATICKAEAAISGGTYALTVRITVSGDHWTSTSPSGETGTGTTGGGPWTSTTSDGTRHSGTAGGG